jgi:hypothetical protein
MNRTVVLRIFAAITPVICVALGTWLVWSQYRRTVTLEEDLGNVTRNLLFQKTMIDEIGSQPLAAKEPAAPFSDAEQSAFLEGLRQIARSSGVTLSKWTNVPSPPKAENDKVLLPAGITPMLSNLEVSGPYEAIRSFLYEVARAPRLLNFSSVRWIRKEDSDITTLSVTITRYVTPPGMAANVPATDPSAPKES